MIVDNNLFIQYYKFYLYDIKKFETDYFKKFIKTVLNFDYKFKNNSYEEDLKNNESILNAINNKSNFDSNKNNIINNDINQNTEMIQNFEESFKNQDNDESYENILTFHNRNEMDDTNIINQNTIMTNNINDIEESENVLFEFESNLKKALFELKSCLIKRGVRGLMNFHKQFLINCNITKISIGDFIKVLELQRIDFGKEISNFNSNCYEIFNYFKYQNNYLEEEVVDYLDFNYFISFFKIKLTYNTRLIAVQNAFKFLDKENLGFVSLEKIKLEYKHYNHPKVIANQINKEQILMEFFDTFELNYNFLANTDNNNSQGISFGEFANYYEYVSFLHEFDKDFLEEVYQTWGINKN